MRYVVLLRGVNVGGTSRVVMAELGQYLEMAGFQEVLTYINSGNIIVVTEETNAQTVAKIIQQLVADRFSVRSEVVAIEAGVFFDIARNAPKWWGAREGWKHNALFAIPPTTPNQVIDAIGQLKPGIEKVATGNGVVYQSMSFEKFSKTTTGKLASNPIYKQLTIRNYNTVQKLAALIKPS